MSIELLLSERYADLYEPPKTPSLLGGRFAFKALYGRRNYEVVGFKPPEEVRPLGHIATISILPLDGPGGRIQIKETPLGSEVYRHVGSSLALMSSPEDLRAIVMADTLLQEFRITREAEQKRAVDV